MRTVVITGASSGIGRATALELGRRGFHIVAAGRSRDRTRPVVERIREAGGSSELLILDLASLESVRRSAKELEERGRVIDVMINNAGVGMAKGVTVDGFETHFAVNHLGHFLFNSMLRRSFRPGTRIITVASAVHGRVEGIDFERLTRPGKSLFRLDEYAVSKLANILYSAELARRQPDWRTYAVHPGFVDTKILPMLLRLVRSSRLLTPEEGAATTLYCATDEDLAGESGRYYARSAEATPSSAARDEELARELWQRSEAWCGLSPQNRTEHR